MTIMPNIKRTDTHRTCTTCNTEYLNTHDHFYYAKRAEGTLQSKCKTCANRWQVSYYRAKNGTPVREWVERNHAYYLEQLKAWRRNNPNYMREYYQRNKVRMNQQRRANELRRMLKRKGLA